MALSTLKQVATPFVAVAKWYTACAKQHPLATAFWTSGIKTSAADLFAQKVIEGRDEIDVKRHLLFCAFGFGYLGSFQYYLYNIKFVQWCAPISNVIGHTATAPFKVFLDQCVHHPFLYFPVFYGLKAGVERKPLSYAVEKYEDEIWESLKALWAVWVPSQLVNFAFVPRHFRVPWVAMTSFVWTIILSLMQGRFDSARAGIGNATDEHASAHYAAMQIHAGIPVDVPAVITALETATPATALLPPSAAAALEADSPAAAAARRGIAATRVSGSGSDGGGKPVAGSPLEPRQRGPAAFEYSFSPYSMAARVAAAAVCR